MAPGLTGAVLDTLVGRIAVIDETGRIVESNASWDAFVAEHDHPLVPDADRPYVDALLQSSNEQAIAVGNRLQALLEGDGDESGEYPYHADVDGEALIVRYTTLDHEGNRYAVVTHTARVGRTEVAADLRLKERVMDEAPVGITISDPDLEDNPVIYANAAFERITGYPVEQVIGRNCRFLQGPDTDPETVAKMRRAVDNLEPVTVEVRNYRRNGEEFWNQVTIAPIYDEDDEPSHYVGFQQDVTDRKEAEEALETERDRLALLNQIVRHDIRNDMAVALGWGGELTDRIPEEDVAAFERVMTAATHTKELTEAVGDLAKILGTIDPELEPIGLDDILGKEIERVRSNFDYRSEEIEIRGDDDLPDVDVLATSILSSVFGNLLDNAVFHNDKADIEIDVDVTVREETAVVRIADNGPGIPDSRKREVFGRGEKGLESPGSGLGLYLVDNLVETYGGRVWIEDNEPSGAVFCVELRRAV
ncbi:PAS domain-containing protein [Haloplanus aerogenes]|uniref:PAS domain S-box-containing protein n=1 Tax=Haloplanus aerogenes TaxID=660522 RepID=A0A3M0CIA0_9EURY|nr:PAS domain-containing protein [Haloplanus aerogenes]AZH24141.1 PAS domain-containing protein [Haloplanus aerogenes]RMB08220.1 PAS domain S-box-containing protein [Haloplanus aerogenes]